MQFQRHPCAGRLYKPIPLGRPERIEKISHRPDRTVSKLTGHPCIVSHHAGRGAVTSLTGRSQSAGDLSVSVTSLAVDRSLAACTSVGRGSLCKIAIKQIRGCASDRVGVFQWACRRQMRASLSAWGCCHSSALMALCPRDDRTLALLRAGRADRPALGAMHGRSQTSNARP